MLHRNVLRAAMAAAVLLAAACDDGTGPAARPASLALASREVSLADGGVDTLAATVLDPRGRPIEGAPVRWTVSDTAVAVVDSSGVLTGNRPGTTFAFATLALQGGSSLRDSARVTVRTTPAKVEVVGRGFIPPAGETFPVQFRVLDRRGQPLPGIEVRFAVTRGTATLTRATAVTDSAGVVSVAARTGTESIDVDVSASVEGVATPASYNLRFPRAVGGLEPDGPLVLTPGCPASLLLRVRDPSTGETLTGQTAAYSVEDSTVVTLADGTGSGTLRGVIRTAVGARVGTTRVVARWLGGILTDTVVVRVEAPVPTRLSLGSDLVLGVGGLAPATARLHDQCGTEYRGPAEITYRSLDPAIVAVAAPEGPDDPADVVAVGPGVGRLVAESGGLRDTLRVTVQDVRLLPADPTIAVGGTATFRAVRTDASGNQVEVPLLGLYTFYLPTPIVSVDSNTKTVRGLAPGTVRIQGVVAGSLTIGTTVRVVAP
jgi:hypothetical protein